MLNKRIIACLDVKNDKVVKGIQFKNHRIVGEIVERAAYYSQAGADELVFYDINASCDNYKLNRDWIKQVAQCINIPFCVAGGIRTLNDAEEILNAGADKISINSPALENPDFITTLSNKFGKQCVVIGIDSLKVNNIYQVCQYTGNAKKMIHTSYSTQDWIKAVQDRGAGEIVLNCMNQDGMRNGYDLEQLSIMRKYSSVPLIASGGAGSQQDFLEVFRGTKVDGALAAGVFHDNKISISELKNYLKQREMQVRL